jgi:hypothetical protein
VDEQHVGERTKKADCQDVGRWDEMKEHVVERMWIKDLKGY